MADDALLRIRSEVSSNAAAEAQKLRAALQQLAASANTTQRASGGLASTQAQGLVDIRRATDAGRISPGDADRLARALEADIRRVRDTILTRLTAAANASGRAAPTLNLPSEDALRRRMSQAYVRGGATDAQAQARVEAEFRQRRQAEDAQRRLEQQRQRLAGVGITPGSLPPALAGMFGGPTSAQLAELRRAAGYLPGTRELGAQGLHRAGIAQDIDISRDRAALAARGTDLDVIDRGGLADALRRYVTRLREAAAAQEVTTQLTSAEGRDLIAATRRLAEARLRNSLIEGEAARAGRLATPGLVDARGRAINAAGFERDLIRGSAAGSRTDVERAAEVDRRLAERANVNTIRTDTARRGQSTAANVRAEAERLLAERELRNSIQRQANAMGGGQSTWFQRAQQTLATRQGGPPRDPTEFQTGRQFLASRALTTAGFAISGAVLYGGFSAIRGGIEDSTQLQQELVLVKSQIDDLVASGDAEPTLFRNYREGLERISVDAGVALNISSKLTRQLAGSFADDQGRPDFGRAVNEGQAALRASQIMPTLDAQVVTDDLTAISRAYDVGFASILDIVTGFSEDYGVVADEVTNFTSRLAPTGAELGFSLEQIAGLGSIAQQSSGVGGSALAESFGRILPALTERRNELYTLLARNPQTREQATQVLDAQVSGDTPAALRGLGEAYDKLDAAQKNQLTNLIGGRREAQAFYAVLARGGALVRALSSDEGQYAGEFDKRWNAYTGTLDYAIDRLKVQGQEFFNVLFRGTDEQGAGLGAGLATVVTGLEDGAEAAQGFASAFGEVNDFMGGFPGKILAVAAALTVMRRAMIFGNTTTGFTGRLAAPFAAGGRFSAYQAPGTPGVVVPPAAAMPPIPPIFGGAPAAAPAAGAGALRGGVAANLVGRGVGARAAGLLAGMSSMLPFLLATAAITVVTDTMAKFDAQMEGIRQKVDAEAQRLFEDGLSRTEVQAQLGAITPGESFAGSLDDRAKAAASDIWKDKWKLLSPALIVAGPMAAVDAFTGEDPRAETWSDAVDEVVRTDRAEDLLARFGEMNENETAALADRLIAGTTERRRKLRDELGLDQNSSQGKAQAAITTAINQLAADPANEEALNLLAEAWGLSGSDVRARVDEALAADAQLEEIGQRRSQAQAEVALIRTLFDDGRIGPQRLVEALEDEIRIAREAYEAQRGATGEAEAYRAYSELLQERNRIYGELFADSFDTQSTIIDQRGGSETGQLAAKVQAAEQALASMRAYGVASTDEAFQQQAADLQDLRREAAVAAMARAGTVDEIRAIADGLATDPPEVAAAQRAMQLTTGAWAIAISTLQRSGESDEDFANLRDLWVEAAAATGEIPDALRDRLEDQLRFLEGALGTIYGAGTQAEKIQGDIDAIRAILGELDGGGTSWWDKVATWGPSPEEIQATNALRDSEAAVAQARAADDPAEAARAEITAATAALETAKPGTEYNQALARLMNAQRAFDDAIVEEAKAALAVRRAQANGDPIALAALDLEAAALDMGAADPGTPAYDNARAAYITAQNNAADAAAAAQSARLDYQRASAGRDAQRIAQIDLAGANAAIANAVGDEEYWRAMAQREQAVNAIRDAALDADSARLEYLQVAAANPIDAAEIGVQIADTQLANAQGAAEKWRAMAGQIQAQRALRDAIVDAFAAQQELAGALYSAAGDTVSAAKTQLSAAQYALEQALRSGVEGPELARLQASVVTAQANLTSTARNDRLGDLEYLYEFDRITAGEYISLLTAELSKIPESNKEARREIERRIRALRDELSQDLAFNLPDIIMPTLYEARRADGSTAGLRGYNASTSYVSNNDVQVQVIVQEPGASAETIATVTADTVAAAFDRPPTRSQTGALL